MQTLCKTKSGFACTTNIELPKKEGDYLYFIQIGEVQSGKRTVKIGTTNNLKRRMSQELRQYRQNIKILWVSTAYSKWTTLRVEYKMKEIWKTYSEWEYIPNDRFIIPESITDLKITVRKDWAFKIG